MFSSLAHAYAQMHAIWNTANVIFESYVFGSLKQEERETTDALVTRRGRLWPRQEPHHSDRQTQGSEAESQKAAILSEGGPVSRPVCRRADPEKIRAGTPPTQTPADTVNFMHERQQHFLCGWDTFLRGVWGSSPRTMLKIVDSISRILVRFTPKIISLFLCFSLERHFLFFKWEQNMRIKKNQRVN